MCARAFRVEAVSKGSQVSLGQTTHSENDDVLIQIKTMHDELKRMSTLLEETNSQVAKVEVVPQTSPESVQLSNQNFTKDDLNNLQEAVVSMSKHISSLRPKYLNRFIEELNTIVTQSEEAANTILETSEAIEDNANTLAARLAGEDAGLAQDIREQMTSIFEACNFQDLTGQRAMRLLDQVSGILGAVEQIENIIADSRLVEALTEAQVIEFNEARKEQDDGRSDDDRLLNGPAFATDTEQLGQDDIDSLF